MAQATPVTLDALNAGERLEVIALADGDVAIVDRDAIRGDGVQRTCAWHEQEVASRPVDGRAAAPIALPSQPLVYRSWEEYAQWSEEAGAAAPVSRVLAAHPSSARAICDALRGQEGCTCAPRARGGAEAEAEAEAGGRALVDVAIARAGALGDVHARLARAGAAVFVPSPYGAWMSKSIGGVSSTWRLGGVARARHSAVGPVSVFAAHPASAEAILDAVARARAPARVLDHVFDPDDQRFVAEISVEDPADVDHVCARLARAQAQVVLDEPLQAHRPLGIERLDRIEKEGAERDEEEVRSLFGAKRGIENWRFEWMPAAWPHVPITWGRLARNLASEELASLPLPLRHHAAEQRRADANRRPVGLEWREAELAPTAAELAEQPLEWTVPPGRPMPGRVAAATFRLPPHGRRPDVHSIWLERLGRVARSHPSYERRSAAARAEAERELALWAEREALRLSDTPAYEAQRAEALREGQRALQEKADRASSRAVARWEADEAARAQTREALHERVRERTGAAAAERGNANRVVLRHQALSDALGSGARRFDEAALREMGLDGLQRSCMPLYLVRGGDGVWYRPADEGAALHMERPQRRVVSAALSEEQSKQLIECFFLLSVERVEDAAVAHAARLILLRYMLQRGYTPRWMGAYRQRAQHLGNGRKFRKFRAALVQYGVREQVADEVLVRLVDETGRLRARGSKGSRSKHKETGEKYEPKKRVRRSERDEALMRGAA